MDSEKYIWYFTAIKHFVSDSMTVPDEFSTKPFALMSPDENPSALIHNVQEVQW